MTLDKANAIAATAHNLHFGGHGEPMTLAKVAKLPLMVRISLCVTLERKGGSYLYSASDAKDVIATLHSWRN